MGTKATPAQLAAQKRADAKSAYPVYLKFNKNTDADLIKWLEQQPNRQGYIKNLIRADMEK